MDLVVVLFGAHETEATPGVWFRESEHEPETQCEAHRVKWLEGNQDVVLGRGKCKGGGALAVALLTEDLVGDAGEVQLCPKHAFEYERRKRVQGCKFQGCTRLGVDESGGVRLCKVHSRRPSPRRRSPARTVPALEEHDPEEPELPPPGNDPPVRLRDLRKVLDEIRDGGHATPFPRTLQGWVSWIRP